MPAISNVKQQKVDSKLDQMQFKASKIIVNQTWSSLVVEANKAREKELPSLYSTRN